MTWILIQPLLVCMEKTRRNSTARTTSVDAGGSDACVPRAKVISKHRGFSWSTWHRTTHRKIFMSFFSGLKCKQKWSFITKSYALHSPLVPMGSGLSRKEWSESGPTPSKLGPISVVIGVGGRRSTEFLWNVKSTLRCFNMFLLVKIFFPRFRLALS